MQFSLPVLCLSFPVYVSILQLSIRSQIYHSHDIATHLRLNFWYLKEAFSRSVEYLWPKVDFLLVSTALIFTVIFLHTGQRMIAHSDLLATNMILFLWESCV